jgi:hypothetical protein
MPRVLNSSVKFRGTRPPVERHRQTTERIRRVARPVVHRMGAQRLELVVVVGAVELERVEAAGAFWSGRTSSAG